MYHEKLLKDPSTFFHVEIEIERLGIKINQKDLSYDEALKLFHDTLYEHIETNERVREAYLSTMQHGSFGFTGSSGGDDGKKFSVHVSASRKRIDTGEKMTCKNRIDGLGPWKRAENLDHWEKIGDDRVCSFCGSIHPMDLIAVIKNSGKSPWSVIDSSDKGYKWYINNRQAGRDIPNAGFGAIKYYRWHDTPEFIDGFNKLLTQFNQGAKKS